MQITTLVMIAIGTVLGGVGIGYDLRGRREAERTVHSRPVTWPPPVRAALARREVVAVRHDARTGRFTLVCDDGRREHADADLRPLRRDRLGRYRPVRATTDTGRGSPWSV